MITPVLFILFVLAALVQAHLHQYKTNPSEL
jgi:hypothetical protein